MVKKISTQTHLFTKVGIFQSSETSKSWKCKLCSFCEPLTWWKITKRHLLTKAEDFSLQVLKVWKIWKNNLCSFCKPPASWKNTQTHLLRKVGVFQNFETSTAWKRTLCLFCNSLTLGKTTQTFVLKTTQRPVWQKWNLLKTL